MPMKSFALPPATPSCERPRNERQQPARNAGVAENKGSARQRAYGFSVVRAVVSGCQAVLRVSTGWSPRFARCRQQFTAQSSRGDAAASVALRQRPPVRRAQLPGSPAAACRPSAALASHFEVCAHVSASPPCPAPCLRR